MTFAEYNTDENFNKPSNAMELVRLGKEEGKTRDEIANSLSPLWKEDKKGNVKKALDYHFNTETAPKAEGKPVEKKEEVKETVTDTSTPTLTGSAKKYNDKQNTLAEVAKKEMLDDIKKDSSYNWQELYDSYTKRADAYKNVDDHFLEGLPTFIFRRYQNGEFGDPKGQDSKLRLAYFMINGVGTALQNASSAIKGGQMQESDYEKFKNSQMQNALQNRWEKNKADTEGAIKALEKEFGSEQDARLAAEQFTRDQKASVKWNMMNQNQKIDALRVTKEIGDMLGGMNTSEIANFIAGAALTGDVNKEEVMAIGIAKLAANSPQILANLPDGNVKDMVMGMIGGNTADVIAGLGGAGGNETDQPTTNDIVLYDGSTIKNPGKYMNNKEFKTISSAADKLRQDYETGKIDEATFNQEYQKLDNIMKEHPMYTTFIKRLKPASKSNAEVTKNKIGDLNVSFDELQSAAKNGSISYKDYNEQFEDLMEQFKKWGTSDKDLGKYTKKKFTSDSIKAAQEKASKKR